VGWGGIDKRIGKRRQIRSVPMAWVRDPSHPDRFCAETNPDGRIVELSVSGAGMIAITHPYLQIESHVMIATLGLTGTVIVRRIDLDVYPGESYYGIEFAEPNGELTQTLHRSLLAKATHAPELYLPRG
jgi:hypothetical protein